MAKRKMKKQQQPKPAPKGPAIKSDETACVILIRDKPTAQWELMARTQRKSVAWRSAYATEKQEHQVLGNKKFEAVVLLETDYEAGRLKSRLKAPPGFVFDPEPKKETAPMKVVEPAPKAVVDKETTKAKKKDPEPEPPACKKCGTDLNKLGYCQDVTCPYNDHKQEEEIKYDEPKPDPVPSVPPVPPIEKVKEAEKLPSKEKEAATLPEKKPVDLSAKFKAFLDD
jgi:hypothetical protein